MTEENVSQEFRFKNIYETRKYFIEEAKLFFFMYIIFLF